MNHYIYAIYDYECSDYYIDIYDADGNYIDEWEIEATESVGNALCVDADENVYTISTDQHTIRKRNSSGTIILTKTETNYIYDIAFGPDGFIYTLEYNSEWTAGYISKRNASDLVSVSTSLVDGTGTLLLYGLTIDADGNFYFVVQQVLTPYQKFYVKWDFNTGAIATQITEHYTFASLAVVGLILANVDWMAHALTLPSTLDGVETDVELEDIQRPMALGSISDSFLVSGSNLDNEWCIGKYDTSLNKIWAVEAGGVGLNYGSIGSCPFPIPNGNGNGNGLTVTTQAVTDILSTTALGNGNITDTGGENPHTRGFCYMEGTEGDPTIEDSKVFDNGEGSYEVGAYTKEITELTKGTNYRVRAYAINSIVTSYGNTVQFKTDSEPTVTTQAVTDIGDVTATGNGTITAINGDTPTKRGICYNTEGSPTVEDSKVEELGLFGTGAFTEKLKGLSPGEKYYVKAYAMNAVGYGYGEEVEGEVGEGLEFTTYVTAYIGYGEWVKFVTAAPGLPGDKPTGYKNDICSDYCGFTYILNRSLTDDGANYESFFVLSTDLSGTKTLHTNKRLLDIFSYFANKGIGTAKVYIKRNSEPEWQEAGEISLTGEEEIVIKHLPVDFLAKHYLFKFVFENDFEFIGMITEAVPIGDRPSGEDK